MTIEIRELVIQAKIAAPEPTKAHPAPRSLAQEKVDEARWIETITQRVLEKLREERGWNQ
ncbi:DUF5908 family protein [Pseudomonas sp. NPDC086251]|uniref:DUF5908 family protein n=1 Tax=Pseudomonas sp. NPDC086251 TaxID=3364431 RepID=UPI0038341F76